ncbi:MAG: BlaI/MecI/CopY family transcriptional regulator [Defluviitaleaceae bacterium]|nr:BlaI/MecI/CopY family transcriptional regulator [Defluviitaleaceae bacterium]
MNDNYTLTVAEERLADIIWQKAPLTSPELVNIAWEKLEWKKSTTYTVLRRLCEKGIFVNGSAIVKVAITREELIASQSRHFVNSSFGGSLPGFMASFFGGKKLSAKEADELKQLIDQHQEE